MEWNGSECEATDLGWDFWPSQPQFYPGVYVTGSHNFIDLSCTCQHTQLSVASTVSRDCNMLYKGPWQTRDWALLQFCIWAQGRNWYWWYYNRVCLSGGYRSRPLLVTSFIASLFYRFFTVNTVAYRKHYRWVKQTTNYCIVLRLYVLRMSCRKRRRWHFRDPKFKNLVGRMP